MKYSTLLPTLAATLISTVAYADNPAVEQAISSRPDLSMFYHALMNTGVNHELDANSTYTIFAPTNAAFAEIRHDQYPCFYTANCRTEVAAIVRNHIIPGSVYLDDKTKQRGGYSAGKGGYYSIGHRFVTIGEPNRNNYAIAGNNVTYTTAFGNSYLYKIDGVIANPRELAALDFREYAGLESEGRVVKTYRKTIPDPACGPVGCADETGQLTTTTREAYVE